MVSSAVRSQVVGAAAAYPSGKDPLSNWLPQQILLYTWNHTLYGFFHLLMMQLLRFDYHSRGRPFVSLRLCVSLGCRHVSTLAFSTVAAAPRPTFCTKIAFFQTSNKLPRGWIMFWLWYGCDWSFLKVLYAQLKVWREKAKYLPAKLYSVCLDLWKFKANIHIGAVFVNFKMRKKSHECVSN